MTEMSERDQAFQKVKAWAATEGRWSFDGANADYLQPDRSDYAVGSVHTNIQASDVTVQLGITFEAIPSNPAPLNETAGGVILGIGGMADERRDAVVALGGAGGAAYSVFLFKPGTGYVPIARSGTIANLRPKITYQVEIIQRGQLISLAVDDVCVMSVLLPEPLAGNQLGLRAWGAERINFTNVKARQTRPSLFVAMQFSDPYEILYEEVIKPKGQAVGFNVVRIDDLTRPGIIFQDIQQELRRATAVVAEISAANNNVFYELGYAHALNKPTILLARRGQDLPFDIRSYRMIFYDDTIGGKTHLEEMLSRYLAAVLGKCAGT